MAPLSVHAHHPNPVRQTLQEGNTLLLTSLWPWLAAPIQLGDCLVSASSYSVAAHQSSLFSKLELLFRLIIFTQMYLTEWNEIDAKFQQMCREQDWVVLGTKGDQLRRGGLNKNLHNAVAKTHAVNLFYRNKTEPEEAYKDEDKIHNQGQSIASGLRAMDEEERVKFFVDRYFTKQKQHGSPIAQAKDTQPQHENIHFLVKSHGDFLQNALIGALVLQTVKEQFPENNVNYDHFGTAAKILKQFSISLVSLAKMQTAKERQEYILQKFTNVITTLLKDWKLKLLARERKQAIVPKSQEQKKLQFQWLNLSTKYTHLQMKLKQMLMEKLNEYENQLLIIDALKHEHERKEIKLQGITKLTTSQLIKGTPPQPHKPIIWTQELETKFLKARAKAKDNYFNKLQVSQFNQIASADFLRDFQIENPTNIRRQELLSKYADGDMLNVEELKFLANTSTLLNSCVDKKQVRAAIRVTRKSQIENLETHLAEEIISNYESLVSKIKEARSRFIKQRIDVLKKTIQERDAQRAKHLECEANRKKNAKLKKTLERICNKMEKNISIKDQVQKSVYAQIFVRTVMYKIKEIRERKVNEERKWNEDLDRQKEIKEKRKLWIQRMARPKSESGQKQRKYHPASKLSFFPTNAVESSEVTDLSKRKEFMSFKEQEYKLGAITAGTNSKDNFIHFYSNGPIKNLRQEPIFVNLF